MRYILYILSNFAVMAVIMFFVHLFGLDQFLTANGIDIVNLGIFSLVLGFTGSIISLFMSKQMAKMSMRVHVIDNPQNETERWLVAEVQKLANEAKVGMPEVGIFEGAPNAFATGANKNSALVAVSTGLLQSMGKEEIHAVLAHELAHVSNGDMVTMALLQGVLNTFVIFLSRLLSYVIAGAMRGNREVSGGSYRIISIILDMALGFLAHILAAYFSRHREFRADAGAVSFMNNNPKAMISALERLKSPGTIGNELPATARVLGISGGIGSLFASHPPLDARIAALRKHAGMI